MKVLIARLKLNDFLTFSSSVGFSVIGDVSYPVYKPQPYIHNYALMYAFAGLLYASLASPTSPRNPSEVDYTGLDKIESKLYVYPARPRHLVIKRLLCNIKGEGYAEPVQSHPKTIYPWHVAHVCFAPGTIFETVVIVKNDSVKLPRTIRLGVKRQGVFKVEYTEALVEERRVSGLSDPINLGDVLRHGLAPDSYVLLLSTKTTRKNMPYSNYVVKGFYREERLVVVKGRLGGDTIIFRIPLLI